MLEYITENGLMLIPVLNVIGAMVKGIDKIPNKYIPLILLAFGVLGAFAIMGVTPQSAIQGVLITGTAVYGDQVIKQFKATK